MRSISVSLISTLLLLSLAACEPDGIAVQDSLDFELFDSQLHTPYVEGADMRLSVWREDGGSVSGWTLRSSDGQVFDVMDSYADEEGDILHGWAQAQTAGDCELEVLDARGRLRASRLVRVARPDSMQMVPAGLSRVRPEDCPRLDLSDSISVLAGGTATFEVAYFKGDERLFGNGVLDFEEPAGLTARNEMTYLFRDREWLVVEPITTGVYDVPLLVNGEPLGTMQARVVEENAIDHVEILAEETRSAEEGEMFYLLARAFDAQGVEIFGVAFDWDVDGKLQSGAGDLYAYHYQDGTWADVGAGAGSGYDSVSVQMDGGYVTSSNNLGCATAPGSDAGLGLLGLMVLGFFVLRRRQACAPMGRT